MQDIYSAADIQLIKNGYEPIACQGKAAVANGWQLGPITPERIVAMRQVYPAATNTGLRTGKLAAIDIDVVDAEHAAAVAALADQTFGPTPLRRVGSKGVMLCYYNPEPVRKITVLTDPKTPGEFADKVECLGTGLQFVAFGIHPATQKPFEWTGVDFEGSTATPLTTPISLLPRVDPNKLYAFAEQCSTLLGTLGYGGVRVRKATDVTRTERPDGGREDDPLNVSRAKVFLEKKVELGEVATLGSLGNDTIYELACELMDRFYLSPALTEELMLSLWYPHCIPNTLEDEAKLIIEHATSYMQNEPGSHALLPATQTFKEAFASAPVEPDAPGEATNPDLGNSQQIVLLDENADGEDLPVPANEYAQKDFPPLKEIIPIWCEFQTNTFLEGPAATQKSRAALQDAIALSVGLPIMGQEPPAACECVYLNYENSPEEMARRVHMICRHLQTSNKDAPINPKGVLIWELRKHPRPLIVVKREGAFITRFGRRFLSLIATRRNLGKHTLVVFDGLMDAIIFSDNTRNDDTVAMSLIRLIDSWCMEYDFSAYSIVHPSRSSERGGTVGSYATAWTTKPRAIQTFKRVLSPYAGGGAKAKITEDTPLKDIFYQRRVQKRSNGPEGERMLLEYRNGGLRPVPVSKISTRIAPDETVTEEF